jgi:hypothetical protein
MKGLNHREVALSPTRRIFRSAMKDHAPIEVALSLTRRIFRTAMKDHTPIEVGLNLTRKIFRTATKARTPTEVALTPTRTIFRTAMKGSQSVEVGLKQPDERGRSPYSDQNQFTRGRGHAGCLRLKGALFPPEATIAGPSPEEEIQRNRMK